MRKKAFLVVAVAVMMVAAWMPMMSVGSSGVGMSGLQQAVDDFSTGSEISGSYIMDEDSTLTPSMEVVLPALAEGRTFTIGGSVTVTYSGSTGVPLFVITEGNEGTYIFKEFTIEVDSVSDSAIRNLGAGKLIIEGMTFQKFMSPAVVCGSEVSISDSTFIDCNGALAMVKDTVATVDNCLFSNGVQSSSSPLIGLDYSATPGDVTLTVANCTFFDVGQFGAVVLDPAVAATYDIAIKDCVFTEGDIMGSAIINISGDCDGAISIEQCHFFGLEAYSSAGLIRISPYSQGVDVTIDGITMDLCTSDFGPMISIENSNATITNSTFWNNGIESWTESGCIYFDNSNADIVHCTFYQNIFTMDASSRPASVFIESNTTLYSVNNVYASSEYDDKDHILGDTSGLVSKGDLETMSSDPFFSLVLDPAGRTVGQSDNSTRISVPVMTPFTDDTVVSADRRGVTESELRLLRPSFTLPVTDQVGAERMGGPDAGSVAINSAMFTPGSGSWGSTVMDYPPYYLGSTGNAASLVKDGAISAPYEHGLASSMILMGWSTSPTDKYPTAGMEYDDTATTGFDVDGIYYSKWGYLVSFDPGKESGLEDGSEVIAPGDTVTTPSYGTVNGMEVSYWSLDADGDMEWDGAPVSGSMTLYAQWTAVVPPVPPTPPVEDSISTGEAVAVTAAAAVASVGAVGVAFTPSGGSQSAIGAVETGGGVDGQERNRRSITFYPRNGRPAWTDFVIAGRIMTSPPADPEPPEGKRFVGWSTHKNGGDYFSLRSPINSNMVVYAIYEDI